MNKIFKALEMIKESYKRAKIRSCKIRKTSFDQCSLCIHTGGKQKLIQPTSLKDPKLEKLKEVRDLIL